MTEIEQLIEKKHWKRARAAVQEALVFSPTDHWLWMSLGLTYYEEKQYEKALECSKHALELQPDCPLALWHYAGALFMNGQESAALAIWNMLLNKDLEAIADDDCGEGMDWALQLLNDVHYRMGRYYQWAGQTESARASFEKYLHNRGHGVTSIYDEKQVKSQLAQLSA